MIAKGAGISQPYLFRLFGTKKELYLATSSRRMGKRHYQAFEARGPGVRAAKTTLKTMGGGVQQEPDRMDREST